MASLNRVMLIGNLGKAPELRQTTSGEDVTNFSIATNEQWTDASGARQKRTTWHNIVVWGKAAKNASQYLSKGARVFVEGRLQNRTWEDKDGASHNTTEIVSRDIQYLTPVDNGNNAPPPTEEY